jgi:phage protein U
MTIDYQTGPTVMLMLGDYQFGIDTAAYQELTRVSEYRWPVQERFMKGQALQFVGPGGDTITLPGTIYPEYRGGFEQLQGMRDTAALGVPLTLIDGGGTIMGSWVIERVEEKQVAFFASGVPRKQEFSLGLRKFDDTKFTGSISADGALSIDALSAGTALTAGSNPLSSLSSFADAAASQVQSITSGISASLATVTGYAGAIGSTIGSVLAPISRAVSVANGLKNSIHDAKSLLGAIPSNLSGISSATKLLNAATSAVANASLSGTLLKRSVADLTALSAPPDAIAAVRSAMINVNKLTVSSTAIQTRSSDLITLLGEA